MSNTHTAANFATRFAEMITDGQTANLKNLSAALITDNSDLKSQIEGLKEIAKAVEGTGIQIMVTNVKRHLTRTGESLEENEESIGIGLTLKLQDHNCVQGSKYTLRLLKGANASTYALTPADEREKATYGNPLDLGRANGIMEFLETLAQDYNAVIQRKPEILTPFRFVRNDDI